MKSIKKEQSSLSRRDNMQGWLSVLPVLVILIVFRGYPIIVGILKSFTNWDGLFRNDFIGLRNYVNILSGDQFWMLLKNNLFLLLYTKTGTTDETVVPVNCLCTPPMKFIVGQDSS